MIGVDEVGRGCWAGPMLVVAARLQHRLPQEIRDSKLMSKSQRAVMYNEIIPAFDFGEGWVQASEIDKYGLSRSLRIGGARALRQIKARLEEEIIVDGNVNYLPKKFKRTHFLVKGDSILPAISAAGIYGKVKRDRYMEMLAKKYPGFYFHQHVGYGTKLHVNALKSYGAIKQVHRFSYQPIAKLTGVAA